MQELGEKYIRLLDYEPSNKTIEVSEFTQLKFQYFLLNFQLSLKEGDLETSKIYESKLNLDENGNLMDANSIIEVSRIIYNTMILLSGREKSADGNKKLKKEIVHFLKKVHAYLDLPVNELRSHVDYGNLRYSILLFLTNCLIDESDDVLAYQNDISRYLELLQNEYPTKIESFILSINFCKKKETTHNAELIEEILMRMIMSVNIIENFDTILGCIKEFAEMNTKLAIICLDYIFSNKLDPHSDQKYLEKILVLRFFLTTQSKILSSTEMATSLEEFCDQIERILVSSMSKHTISSIVTLLWNTGKQLEKQYDYSKAAKFYELSLKNVISQGYHDKAKIQRALQNSYLNLQDLPTVERIFNEMTSSDQDDPLTQLLMLRVSLFKDDTVNALKYLRNIQKAETKISVDILILGVAECKRSTELAIDGLQLLFEKLKTVHENTSWPVPTLCLLRYTLQMVFKMVEDEGLPKFKEYISIITKLLEKAHEYLQRIKILNKLNMHSDSKLAYEESVSVDEIEWFCSMSYNSCVKSMQEGIKVNITTLSALTVKFIDLIPIHEFTFPKMSYYKYWKYRCHILDILVQRQNILNDDGSSLENMQQEISELLENISNEQRSSDFKACATKEDIDKFNVCFVDLLQLEYEIALELRDRDKILTILEKTEQYQNGEMERLLIDIALNKQEFSNMLLTEIIQIVLRRNVSSSIIDDYTICIWSRTLLEKSDTIEIIPPAEMFKVLSKRFLMSNLSFDTSPEIKKEIEAISTSCWNTGVNFLIKEDKENGVQWCGLSITYAKLVNEGLSEQLSGLWVSLAESADIDPESIH
ncbi:hypothetical protein NCAS_0A13670 [Naumovozyma castellii]|uniref:Protein ZIP4 homolog n=1 Tax=Naumovozyma castellii TaxID=27288 RepID=G0V8X6_NAUCA|nr:hypothetical protein NCAS_0A13670 [Naumovozyma castellii CBS 4309]CCC67925.1 hypothetical protein NCAS_0A13670 [Naumovozyma castellii CBS 4309]